MKTLLFALILGAIWTQGSSHQMQWGPCKTLSYMKDFDPTKFEGTWYVNQKLVTTSSCLMAKFGMDGENTLTIQELRTPFLTQMGPWDMTVTNVGKLEMDSSNKAKMKLKWSGNPVSGLVTTNYGILDTDYVTYAADIECQSLGIIHRLSATIYSRERNLDQAIVDKLRQQLAAENIKLDRMSTIDHTGCVALENNDFNIQVDDNGLSLLGALKDPEISLLKDEEQILEFAKKNIPAS